MDFDDPAMPHRCWEPRGATDPPLGAPVPDWDAVATELLARYWLEVTLAGHPLWVTLRFAPDGTLQERPFEPDRAAKRSQRPPRSPRAAVAVIATGRCRPAGDVPFERPERASGPQGSCVLCCVAARSGLIGWCIVGDDERIQGGPPEGGILLDELRSFL